MVTPAQRRDVVAHLIAARQMSERRARRVTGVDPVRYRSRRPDDAELRARLRALAHARRRFGYRLHDQMTDGRRFRVLVIVNECTRECLGLAPDTSISGQRVAREFDRIIA